MSGEGDIEKMVLKPTWKEVLIEMISTERLDPWNIDITVLANGFLQRVKKMKDLDLHVPANIILAAAILLKYQSNALRIVPEIIENGMDDYDQGAPEDIPRLELVSRIPPKGPITLEELVNEMERTIRYDNPEQKIAPKKIEDVINMPAPQFDIEERMLSIFERVRGSLDTEGWAIFSRIVEKKENDEIVHTLLPLLHLSQKKIVHLRQDEFFGEIFIKLGQAEESSVLLDNKSLVVA